MDYVIFDLKMDYTDTEPGQLKRILEIGAVKLNEKLQVCGQFQSLVQPATNPDWTPALDNTFGISPTEICAAQPLLFVLDSFTQWLGQDYILCSWGTDNYFSFKRNCEYYGLPFDWFKNHLDLQECFSSFFKLGQNLRLGLKNALRLLEIPALKAHRALDDASCMAAILNRMYDEMPAPPGGLSLPVAPQPLAAGL